jgi:hypothetical protein
MGNMLKIQWWCIHSSLATIWKGNTGVTSYLFKIRLNNWVVFIVNNQFSALVLSTNRYRTEWYQSSSICGTSSSQYMTNIFMSWSEVILHELSSIMWLSHTLIMKEQNIRYIKSVVSIAVSVR